MQGKLEQNRVDNILIWSQICIIRFAFSDTPTFNYLKFKSEELFVIYVIN